MSSTMDLGVRAHSTTTFRDVPAFYAAGYGDFLPPSALGGAGRVAPSASLPSLNAAGSARALARRFSAQLSGPPLHSPLAHGRAAENGARSPAVFCMLPLDTVNLDGVFRYAGSAWFAQALQMLVASGAHGVAMDFWWGAIEKAPGQYNWSGYKQALEVIKQTGLKVQAVLSFHACGGNVGDTVQVPLPEWVLQCGEADPDLFFTDRPRNGGLGNRNREYISIWADDAPGVLRGRSPMQCYEDFMVSLRDNFSQELGTVIDEVVVGAGPCGELRLPSYVEANGWRFPGAGEFQCYDRRALASLAQAAREAGHPEWGYTGPHDAGEYNSTPEHTGFFSYNGSWNTPYGRFFLEWYSGCLLRHGDRLLSIANQVFASKLVSAASCHPLAGSSSMLHTSCSQQFQLLPLSGAFSGGRISTMSLNRILETGGSGVATGELGPVDGYPMAPPASLAPRHGADGVASASPSCTCSSVSAYAAISSSGTGSSGSNGSSSCHRSNAPGSVHSMHSDFLVPGDGPPEPVCVGSASESSGGASASEPVDVGVTVGAAVARGVTVVAACTALIHGSTQAGVVGVSGVAPPAAGGGGAALVAAPLVDATMIDVEPSDASHTSTVAAEMLPAPPLSGSANHSGPLSHPPATAPSASPLAAMRFRSSASTLAESEPMGGLVTAAAAAAGTIVASGGTARLDLCNSLSSLSTEFTTTGGGGNQPSMLFLDVAASLVADGDDESDIGTSCCTGGVPEEADDLFAIGAGQGRGSGMSDHGAMAPGSTSDDGARSSAELGVGVGVGLGLAAAAPMASSLASPSASCPAPAGGGMHLALKIAGIHWWYRSRSHAAELTAGYYNVEGHDGYAAIVDMCARHRANLVLTCVEMCDSQHPVQAQCGPEGLLRQLRQLAARAGVSLSGENALPIFSSGGVDTDALDRIAQNMRSWAVPGLQRGTSPAVTPTGQQLAAMMMGGQHGYPHPPLSSGGGGNIVCIGYRMSESGRMVPVGMTSGAMAAVNAQPEQAQPTQQQQPATTTSAFGLVDGLPGASSVSAACPSPAPPDVLPALRAFTFLRLVPEMLLPGYQGLWLRFMGKLMASRP